ncbi:MAG: sugar kinase [Sphingobacteriales bacterium 50-39]|nr:ROK family protein [Sphingobacteriales bacterium]OJW59437.1 MAG: sugar kinase [Sphingobacteriales bacterium 50-39]
MTEKNVLYKKRIIKELYFSNNSSCSDLSTRTHTSLPLVTKMLNELLEENVIVETGYAPSTGGRRPLLYSLRPDVFYVVAVAMDQYFTRMVIMDMQRRPVTRVKEVELSLANHPGAAQSLADNIEAYVRESGIPKKDIAGVGIGMPGFVDGKKGVNYTFLDVADGSLTHFITVRTGIPTFIENDSSLIALAEFRFGAARNRNSAMVINLGWGIGLGMILNGEIFRGYDGFAGEFSHLPLFSNNKLCSCGKSGCLETEASLLVVVSRAEEGIRNGRVTLLDRHLPAANADKACRAVISAAEKGDKFAVELLSEAGYNIGRGVAILIHLLNPEMIVLSGRGSSAGRIWQTPIQQALNEHCIPRLAANVSIEISQLGINAELTGAAALVMENYLRHERGRPAAAAGKKVKVT